MLMKLKKQRLNENKYYKYWMHVIKHAEVYQEDLSLTNYQELAPNDGSFELQLDSFFFYCVEFNSFKNTYVWFLMIHSVFY